MQFARPCVPSLSAIAAPFLLACSQGEDPDQDVARATEESAATRSFQMALWDNPAGVDADLAFFSEGQVQPSSRSILFVWSWWEPNAETNPNFARALADKNYDWSRIVAVVIDEPYWFNTGNTDWSNPCRNPGDPRNAQVARTATQLADAAAVIRDISPSTRLWINFSVPEIQWASDHGCPIHINQWYIDVISLDSYWGTFRNVVRPHYDWLYDNRATPYQQFALVPGTFFRDGVDDQDLRAWYLQGYFDYAKTSNQRCELPLGRVGITGNWDGCLVWLIAGWPASSPQGDQIVWRGALDPLSSSISATWRTQLANPKLDPMLGHVELYNASTRTFAGWAINRNTTGQPPYIDLWVDGQHWGTTVANQYRPNIGDLYGVYEAGFSFTIPQQYVDGRCRRAQIYAVAPTAEPHNHVLLPSAVDMRIC
jgi:hypothetical protein